MEFVKCIESICVAEEWSAGESLSQSFCCCFHLYDESKDLGEVISSMPNKVFSSWVVNVKVSRRSVFQHGRGGSIFRIEHFLEFIECQSSISVIVKPINY